MKILYAGDSPVGGAANYLLGIFTWMKAGVVHLPPPKNLTPQILKQKFDAIIFSDYSSDRVSKESQEEIVSQIKNGTGFLMVGGWGSFTGVSGRWRDTLIEKNLPVRCLNGDDRTHFPGGASVTLKTNHPMFHSVSFSNPPIICGLNRVMPKENGTVLLSAKRILIKGGKAKLESEEVPLLIVDSLPNRKVAALTTDAAPHWCGGLVDWGNKRIKINVNASIQIEVGNRYVQFFASLIRWLAGGVK